MEIRTILQGKSTSFAPVYPTQQAGEKSAADARPAADRVELSRQWVEQMEDQRKQLLALLSRHEDRENRSDGLLGMLDDAEQKKEELDGLSEQLKVQHKCLIIAMRIMQGKKVPLKDELYLMEHDPEGYKLAMALRKPPKKDEKECKSVLDDEDEQTNKTSNSEETAPAESGGGEPAASDSGEATE